MSPVGRFSAAPCDLCGQAKKSDSGIFVHYEDWERENTLARENGNKVERMGAQLLAANLELEKRDATITTYSKKIADLMSVEHSKKDCASQAQRLLNALEPDWTLGNDLATLLAQLAVWADEAKPFKDALTARHNGYDARYCRDTGNVSPATPQQALDELLEEERATACNEYAAQLEEKLETAQEEVAVLSARLAEVTA